MCFHFTSTFFLWCFGEKMEYMVLNPVSSVFTCPPVEQRTIMQYDPILQTIYHLRATMPARVHTDGTAIEDFQIDKYLRTTGKKCSNVSKEKKK